MKTSWTWLRILDFIWAWIVCVNLKFVKACYLVDLAVCLFYNFQLSFWQLQFTIDKTETNKHVYTKLKGASKVLFN